MTGRLLRRVLNRLARAGWFIWFLLGCGGPAFEQLSHADAELAGSPSVAGSFGVGVSALPSGGAGVAGEASSETGNDAGAAVVGGAAGDVTPVPSHPCDVSTWTAQAFASRAAETSPAAALDGDNATRWTAGVAQAPGQWFALELGAGVVLERLSFKAPAQSPDDVPPALELELDGAPVEARAALELGALELAFPARAASSARVVLTQAAPAWWSIAEIQGVCQ